MRKLLLIAAGAVAILFVGALSFIYMRQGAVVAAFSEKTGLAIASPQFSVWPRFSIAAPNMTVPSGNGTLADFGEIHIYPKGGLFSFGKAEIAEVVLDHPRLELVIDRDGNSNWLWTSIPGLPVRINDGTLRFHDDRSNTTSEIGSVAANAAVDDETGGLSLKGSFVWNKRPSNFTLYIKSPQRLAASGSAIDLTLQAPSLGFEFSGLASIANDAGLAGQASVSSDNLELLAEWFDAMLPASFSNAKITLDGAFTARRTGIVFRDSHFIFNDMKGQGDVGLALRDGRPQAEIRAGMDQVDINAVTGAADAGGPSPLLAEWPTTRLDFSALRTFDATINLSANKIIYGHYQIGPGHLTLKAAGGKVDIALADATFEGGSASGQMTLDGSGETPAIKLNFNGSDMDGEGALASFVGLSNLKGKLSAGLAVETSGTSLAEMISRLSGQATFRSVNGTLAMVDLGRMAGAVTERVLEGWQAEPSLATPFDAFSGTFRIADGVAKTDALILTSPALMITSRGEIDLLRQAVDL
ncbi:MAG: AsmA-like C-terminal region-containing protein, partial [Parvibaculaceae bacterium]